MLQEFYVTVTRKFKKPMTPQAAAALMDEYRVFPMVPTDYPLIVSGVELALEHGISYWDGAIVAAAEALEAEILYTEDLNHEQLYGKVRAVNPILPAGHVRAALHPCLRETRATVTCEVPAQGLATACRLSRRLVA